MLIRMKAVGNEWVLHGMAIGQGRDSKHADSPNEGVSIEKKKGGGEGVVKGKRGGSDRVWDPKSKLNHSRDSQRKREGKTLRAE